MSENPNEDNGLQWYLVEIYQGEQFLTEFLVEAYNEADAKEAAHEALIEEITYYVKKQDGSKTIPSEGDSKHA